METGVKVRPELARCLHALLDIQIHTENGEEGKADEVRDRLQLERDLRALTAREQDAARLLSGDMEDMADVLYGRLTLEGALSVPRRELFTRRTGGFIEERSSPSDSAKTGPPSL